MELLAAATWKGSAPRKLASSRHLPTRLQPIPGWTSSNWSGYAIQSKPGSFRQISASWVVPRIKPGRIDKFSSAWIGIDGFDNPFLIQTGTEHDTQGGKPSYYAWWEILPAPETRINRRVCPGDLMHARIAKLRAANQWLIVLKNKTKGWTFRKVVTYTGPASTAEWIMEAPSLNGETTRLANYGKIRFCKSRLNRANALLKRKYRGVMIQNGRIVSTPSLPSKSGDRFTVAYGSRIPLPPKGKQRS